MIGNSEAMSDRSMKTKIAFYAWLWLLLASLATFAVGLSGHIVALLAWPWLSLKAQAEIHTGIPVFLTAVKFVTVPVLVVLTPFARHHPTFEGWTEWSKKKFERIEGLGKLPYTFVKGLFAGRKSNAAGHEPDKGPKKED
jgi:hypothetical protein